MTQSARVIRDSELRACRQLAVAPLANKQLLSALRRLMRALDGYVVSRQPGLIPVGMPLRGRQSGRERQAWRIKEAVIAVEAAMATIGYRNRLPDPGFRLWQQLLVASREERPVVTEVRRAARALLVWAGLAMASVREGHLARMWEETT